jgi:hypothetical protein
LRNEKETTENVNQMDATSAPAVKPVPVALFAYARPDTLRETLKCLRDNRVPMIYAFSDGARTDEQQANVETVRRMLKSIDWADVSIVERPNNFGLGRSIITGVTELLRNHESLIVFEDDLICVPGTYTYMCAALDAYVSDNRVMSVTGWTHPQVTPTGVKDLPYFDGRAECWVWGTWSRAWQGMENDAKTLMAECESRGIDVHRYGADLPAMAEMELDRNIWAVRFLYLHILRGGLCLRPPWSMVEHIGFGDAATNATEEIWLKQAELRAAPRIPDRWPTPEESAECAALHRAVSGYIAPDRKRIPGFLRTISARFGRTNRR